MQSEILTRSALALLIILAGLGFYYSYNWFLRRRVRKLLPDLGTIRTGRFTLVYFTTPTCVPCKTIQRPAIQKIREVLGKALHVVEIDASERPELASRWGVMSVPTTFVIDRAGKVRHINHGVTRAETLLQQIQG